MTFIKFNKNNVNYTLFLGNHVSPSYPLIKSGGGLKSLDVLVLEGSGYSFNRFFGHIQYEEILEKIPYENPGIKIYNVDCGFTTAGGFADIGVNTTITTIPFIYILKPFREHKITRREAVKRLGYLGLGLVAVLSDFGPFTYVFSDKEDNKIISSLTSARTSLIPLPKIGFRDAVNAKIIEEYVVPNEKKRSNTLNIGILFGGGHSGIKEKIKYKFLRDKTVNIYKKFDYPGIDKDTLNKIERVTYQYRAYRIENIFLDLF